MWQLYRPKKLGDDMVKGVHHRPAAVLYDCRRCRHHQRWEGKVYAEAALEDTEKDVGQQQPLVFVGRCVEGS